MDAVERSGPLCRALEFHPRDLIYGHGLSDRPKDRVNLDQVGDGSESLCMTAGGNQFGDVVGRVQRELREDGRSTGPRLVPFTDVLKVAGFLGAVDLSGADAPPRPGGHGRSLSTLLQ